MSIRDDYLAELPFRLCVAAITVGTVGAIAHLILQDPLWFDIGLFAAGVVGLAAIGLRKRMRRPTPEEDLRDGYRQFELIGPTPSDPNRSVSPRAPCHEVHEASNRVQYNVPDPECIVRGQDAFGMYKVAAGPRPQRISFSNIGEAPSLTGVKEGATVLRDQDLDSKWM